MELFQFYNYQARMLTLALKKISGFTLMKLIGAINIWLFLFWFKGLLQQFRISLP